MVRMINAITGSEMWVADERLEEYKAQGHLLYDACRLIEKAPEKPQAKKSTDKPVAKKGSKK